MDQIQKIRMANIFRYMARYGLLIMVLVIAFFATVSGSEAYENKWLGIWYNLPNASPWIVLLALVPVAWKWEFTGGILVTIVGLGLFVYFNFLGNNFFVATFVITLIILLLGILFITSALLRRNA